MQTRDKDLQSRDIPQRVFADNIFGSTNEESLIVILVESDAKSDW